MTDFEVPGHILSKKKSLNIVLFSYQVNLSCLRNVVIFFFWKSEMLVRGFFLINQHFD